MIQGGAMNMKTALGSATRNLLHKYYLMTNGFPLLGFIPLSRE